MDETADGGTRVSIRTGGRPVPGFERRSIKEGQKRTSYSMGAGAAFSNGYWKKGPLIGRQWLIVSRHLPGQ